MSDEEILEVNEDSGDTNEEDSSSDEEINKELENRAQELEAQLSDNNYLYDCHVELVNVYRRLGELDSLRASYKRFQNLFPLTSEIWLDWINDEIKVASTKEGEKDIFDLFDKATEDYLSVKLWLQYATYTMNSLDYDATRKILEKALNSAGLHVSDGILLWDFLRQIDLAQLALHKQGSPEWKEQANRVVEVFRRQLSVPLFRMETTYEEWSAWTASLPEGHGIDLKSIEWGYRKALKTYETYKVFEDKLLEAVNDNELYLTYKEYITTVKDPSTIICLYERAVASLCLNPNIWNDYYQYMSQLGVNTDKILNRAVRNCPWSEELWIAKLRTLEGLAENEQVILECFEQGLASISPSPGLNLWLTYIEYLRRNETDANKIEKVFGEALQYISGDADPTFKLRRLHARLAARRGDMNVARSSWNKIVTKSQNKGNASVWLEFAALEKQFGDSTHVRSVYQKALNACSDWPEYIAEDWLMYERECGSLTDMLKCEEKCKNIPRTAQPLQQQTERNNAEELTSRKRKYESTKHTYETKRKRENNVDVKKSKKSSDDHQRDHQVRPHIVKDPKITVFISNILPNVDVGKLKDFFPNAINIEIVHDRKGKSRCFAYVQFNMEEEVLHALARDREPLDGRPVFISSCKPDKNERKPLFKYSAAVEDNKLFVRGLPIKRNKEEVAEIFKEFNPTDVRLVLHKSGQPKGLAYIEFKDGEDAKKALKATNQLEVDGHVITVAISAPPPKKKTEEVAEPVRHARSRLQVPLIPRSLQVGSSSKSSNGGAESVTEKVSKSNDDFRKMLLKP